MKVSSTISRRLRDLINEETKYRSGPDLVEFFNELGFSDSYGPGFPSRKDYTDQRLKEINGTKIMDSCIRQLFSPVNFVGNFEGMKKQIEDFNQYLKLEGYQVVLKGKSIYIQETREQEDATLEEEKEEFFFDKIRIQNNIKKLGLEASVEEVLISRVEEIGKSYEAENWLSTLFLCGSTLEGVFLGVASQFPKEFNTSPSTPTDTSGKPKQFPDWKLADFIDVAKSKGILGEEVKKYSHALRDFRNYIHPYEQIQMSDTPAQHTSEMSCKALRIILEQIIKYKQS